MTAIFVKEAGQMLSAEFVARLDAAFPPAVVDSATFDRDKLIFAAGSRKVVEWIKHNCSQKGTAQFDNRTQT